MLKCHIVLVDNWLTWRNPANRNENVVDFLKNSPGLSYFKRDAETLNRAQNKLDPADVPQPM